MHGPVWRAGPLPARGPLQDEAGTLGGCAHSTARHRRARTSARCGRKARSLGDKPVGSGAVGDEGVAQKKRRGLLGRPPRETRGAPRATFKQLLPHLLVNKPLLAGIIAISVFSSALSLAQPLLVNVLIGQVEAGTIAAWVVWVLVGAVVIGAIANGVQHFLLQRTGESIVLNTRRRLVAKLLRLPVAEFDARRTGDLVSRVGSDTTMLRAVLTQGLVEAIGGALTFLGAVIAMIVLDGVLFLITFAVVVVALLLVVGMSMRIREASAAAQQKVGDLTASVERAISSVRTVRAFGATEREERLVDADAVGAYQRGLDVARISAFIVPVAGFAMQGALIAVLGVGGLRVAAGDLSIANLIAFIMFLFMMIMPLGLFFGALTAVNTALGALGRIEEIIAIPEEGSGDRAEAPLVVLEGPANEHAAPDASAVEFDNVSFHYPEDVVRARAARERAAARLETIRRESSRGGMAAAMTGAASDPDARLFAEDRTEARVEAPLVLDGVSFALRRGERLALVGPSGSGKSTALALLERFYDPTGGSIRLGGIDLRSIDRQQLRAQLGYVQQDAPVLAGSLRENLLLGRPDADDIACEQVLREVNLGDVLDRSDDRLDTQVGESGVMLSGGERQRLAIARALLSAPPILLLDESTSALDGANERLMRDALDKVSEGRSVIVIAHRLSTVVDSDEIVVLEHGTVLGRGTHLELVDSVPLYRELAQHQLLLPR